MAVVSIFVVFCVVSDGSLCSLCQPLCHLLSKNCDIICTLIG
jgi:hypothetical protein